MPEGTKAGSAQIGGRLLQGFINLLEAGYRLAVTYRQLPQGHADDDDPQSSRQGEGIVVKGHDEGQADKSTGQGYRQHGQKIHESPSRKTFTDSKESQGDTEQGGNRRRGHSRNPGVFHDAALEHAFHKVAHGKGIIRAKGFCKGKEQHHAHDKDDGRTQCQTKGEETPGSHRPAGNPDQTGHRFTGHRHIRILFQVVALHKEHQHRRHYQEHRQRGAHGQIPRAHHLGISFRSQHMIVAAYQHGVTKIRQAVDGHQQKGAGQTRGRQTQGHGLKQIPAFGAQILRRQLQVGTDTF